MEKVGWTGPDVWFAHGIYFNDDEIKRLAETRTGGRPLPGLQSAARLRHLQGAPAPGGGRPGGTGGGRQRQQRFLQLPPRDAGGPAGPPRGHRRRGHAGPEGAAAGHHRRRQHPGPARDRTNQDGLGGGHGHVPAGPHRVRRGHDGSGLGGAVLRRRAEGGIHDGRRPGGRGTGPPWWASTRRRCSTARTAWPSACSPPPRRSSVCPIVRNQGDDMKLNEFIIPEDLRSGEVGPPEARREGFRGGRGHEPALRHRQRQDGRGPFPPRPVGHQEERRRLPGRSHHLPGRSDEIPGRGMGPWTRWRCTPPPSRSGTSPPSAATSSGSSRGTTSRWPCWRWTPPSTSKDSGRGLRGGRILRRPALPVVQGGPPADPRGGSGPEEAPGLRLSQGGPPPCRIQPHDRGPRGSR